MLAEVAKKECAMSDQNALHRYYSDWSSNKELHLDERYNIFDQYIDIM